MKITLLLCLMVIGIMLPHVTLAQTTVIKGQVVDAKTNESLPGVTVVVKGTNQAVSSDVSGMYTIRTAPGKVLVFSCIGYQKNEVTVGNTTQINIRMETDYKMLNEVVITALGIKEERKTLGIAVTEVKGNEIIQSRRTNFVDALQGRVPGLTVNQSSGLPGASSSVVIRGISSLSGSNEPLYIVDGLPYNNKTFSTSSFATASNTGQSLENRGVDFTNRGADINPEDIETVTVLKGPEATSLYGIDASNGAIVITTKRGKAGELKVNYSNSFSFTKINKLPQVQQVYGQGRNGTLDTTYFQYFGEPYAPGTKLYDNIKPFFQTGFSQRHNVSFEGGSQKTQYRLSASYTDSKGIVPTSDQNKLNISNTIRGEISKYFNFDFTMAYTNDKVDRVLKSAGGPMIGLLMWPSRDNAQIYLNPDGTRRKITGASDSYENPYFNINKNKMWTKNSRVVSGIALNVIPTDWLKIVGKFGLDIYTEQNFLLRHPESNLSGAYGGLIDDAVGNNRNLSWESYAMLNHQFGDFKLDLKMGGTIYDQYYKSVAGSGEGFLDPNFSSLNNIPPANQRTRSVISQKRVVGAIGIFTLNYKSIFNLQISGRNDISSTLPLNNNSFFYPGANFAFLLSEIPAIKSLKWLEFAKIRGAYAIARKDPPPYGVYPALETQLTTGGGYGYGFTGPNPLLKPEKTTSYEGGLELMFFKGRLGFEGTYYKKESVDQIISNLRLSYATGYVLSVMNGGSMWNNGIELLLNGTPISNNFLRWDISANFNKMNSKLTFLPTGLLEYYNSDTWFYGNVRNGAVVGQSTSTISGLPYERNKKGDILINPQSGLPLRLGTFGKIGDRNPDFSVGIFNRFAFKNFEFSFLLDTRKGGDVINLTEHQLVLNGLSTRTLNRETPVVVKGVLKDGFQDSDHPTLNNVQILPSRSGASYYYTTPSNGLMNEEDYVEHNISWVRLKDVTLSYIVPKNFLASHLKTVNSLSVYATATDLFLITNYRGLDPVIMGNNAAVSGSGSAGMDYGNFPLPIGFVFGLKIGF
jgi:TonB-linked SusC/RagA family outer membrane protein